MWSNFVARGMLPSGHKSGKNMITHVFKPGEEEDAWPAKEENVDGNVHSLGPDLCYVVHSDHTSNSF